MNIVALVGRFAREPELRYTESGTAVCNFTLAVRNPFDKDNNADFISCVAWGRSGEIVAEYHHTGDEIAINGRLRSRSYVDNNDVKKYVTEVNVDTVHLVSGRKQDDQEDEQDQEETPPPPPRTKPKPKTNSNTNRGSNGNRSNSRSTGKR